MCNLGRFRLKGENFKGFYTSAMKAWQEAGRGPEKPKIIVRVNHGFLTPQPIEGERQFLTGSVDQVREDVKLLAEGGADGVFFDIKRRYFHLPDGFQKIMEEVNLLRGVVE